ncbi:hypothetical protein NW754_001996 [Fusarium falciforme]|nr:hypothetical protein NW754_001996 [Fusarium falciforme]
MPSFFQFTQGSESRVRPNDSTPLLGRFRAVPRARALYRGGPASSASYRAPPPLTAAAASTSSATALSPVVLSPQSSRTSMTPEALPAATG